MVWHRCTGCPFHVRDSQDRSILTVDIDTIGTEVEYLEQLGFENEGTDPLGFVRATKCTGF